MAKKKPTPQRKADQSRRYSVTKNRKNKPAAKAVLTEFFRLVRQARTSEEIALSRAAASGAALALGRLQLLTPERTVDALETIEAAALARSLELTAGCGGTLQ